MYPVALAEWLRRQPAKLMGSARVGSNPTGDDFLFNVWWIEPKSKLFPLRLVPKSNGYTQRKQYYTGYG